jgi:phosphoribosylaminoimidazole (AIR) synthetase
MGIGLVLVVPNELAVPVIARLTEAGESAHRIGEVFRGPREVDLI